MKVIRYPLRKVMAVPNITARVLQTRIEQAQQDLAKLQARIGDYDTLATRVTELPAKLTHPVMIPLGKRAFIPGNIVRSNEILTHLGDDYFAWQSAAEAVGVIDRKKQDLGSQVQAAEAKLAELQEKTSKTSNLFDLQKLYEQENIKEIQESEAESESAVIAPAAEEDVEEYFEIEEEERRKNEQAVWDWDEVMRRMEELESREESGARFEEEEEELEQKQSVPKTAADWKAKGNDAFAKRKYQESIQYYSQAIDLEPSSHILYGNRSAAYHRLKKYADALNDANDAVQCDPSWVKGHYRKACALSALNRYQEAAEAYERAFELCPTDSLLEEKAKDMRTKHAKQVAPTPARARVAAPVATPKTSFTAATGDGLKPVRPSPLTSSSAAFSGSIMERNIEEKAPAKPIISPASAVQTPAFTAPRNRFINEKSEDALTMQVVGEPQPVKRVSRFRAARGSAS